MQRHNKDDCGYHEACVHDKCLKCSQPHKINIENSKEVKLTNCLDKIKNRTSLWRVKVIRPIENMNAYETIRSFLLLNNREVNQKIKELLEKGWVSEERLKFEFITKTSVAYFDMKNGSLIKSGFRKNNGNVV